MTQKSLGQVLYEEDCEQPFILPWPALNAPDQENYERMASAVAAVVREQCAEAAWSHYMDRCKAMGMPPAEFGGWCVAAAIRSMKT